MTVTQKEFREEIIRMEREAKEERHGLIDKVVSLIEPLNAKLDHLSDVLSENHTKNELIKKDLENHKDIFTEFRDEVKSDIKDIKQDNEGFKKVIWKV